MDSVADNSGSSFGFGGKGVGGFFGGAGCVGGGFGRWSGLFRVGMRDMSTIAFCQRGKRALSHEDKTWDIPIGVLMNPIG